MLSPLGSVVIKTAGHAKVWIFPVVNEQKRDKLLAAGPIYFVEARKERAVEVEHAQNAAGLY